MKKFVFLFVLVLFFLSGCEKPDISNAEELALKSADGCTTIQSGEILASDGSVVEVGYDQWGYNYQAQMFNGFYENYMRPTTLVEEGDRLIMKWNDAWISTKDCNGDGKLDRHYGFPSYIGSGAWLTNHMKGEYENTDGSKCHWTYFVKIIAVPADATKTNGVWYNANGTEIGPDIWGQFAVIEEISNDPCNGDHGVLYASPDHKGLGNW